MNDRYDTTVVRDKNGDLYIPVESIMANQLALREGDRLTWVNHRDGRLVVTRKPDAIHSWPRSPGYIRVLEGGTRQHPEWDGFDHIHELTYETAQFEWYWGRLGDDLSEPQERLRRGVVQPHLHEWLNENIKGGWATKTADHHTDPKYTYETILIGFHDPAEADFFDKTWLQA